MKALVANSNFTLWLEQRGWVIEITEIPLAAKS